MAEKLALDLSLVLPEVSDARDACVSRSIKLPEAEGFEKIHLIHEDGGARLCLHYDPTAALLNPEKPIRRMLTLKQARQAYAPSPTIVWSFYLFETFVILGRPTIRRAVCRLLTAGMLFAQAIGVAQACVEAAPSPTMAFTQTEHDGDCGKAVNQNACLQQCTAGDQSSAQVQVAVAALPAIVALTVPVVPDAVVRAVMSVSLSHSPDPPPSIRFCSFQL